MRFGFVLFFFFNLFFIVPGAYDIFFFFMCTRFCQTSNRPLSFMKIN